MFIGTGFFGAVNNFINLSLKASRLFTLFNLNLLKILFNFPNNLICGDCILIFFKPAIIGPKTFFIFPLAFVALPEPLIAALPFLIANFPSLVPDFVS